MAALGNFVLDLFHTDDSRYEQAGRDRRDRHHDGVGQKIKEIKELHSDHGNARQRTISEAGECSEKDHDNGHKDGRFFPAPVQLILEGGYGALGQGDGACDRRKQDEEKEQDPCACSESHARKYLRKCDEHEGRSSLESIRVAAGEGKDGRNDHESGHDRDRSVKDLNIFRRILDRGVLFHIGAERDEDSHRDRQGVEHLPHRGDDGHPGEVFEGWNQEIFHACHRARSCHGVDRDDHGEDHEDRHHKF